MRTDEQQIRDLVATWMHATKTGDIEKVLSLMTDDVVFLMPGQPSMKGKTAYAAAARAQPKEASPQFDGSSEIQEIQVLGEWAYMWSRLKVIVTIPGGLPVTRAGHTLSVLKKEQGRWLLARDANMLTIVKEDGQ